MVKKTANAKQDTTQTLSTQVSSSHQPVQLQPRPNAIRCAWCVSAGSSRLLTVCCCQQDLWVRLSLHVLSCAFHHYINTSIDLLIEWKACCFCEVPLPAAVQGPCVRLLQLLHAQHCCLHHVCTPAHKICILQNGRAPNQSRDWRA